MLGEQWQSKSVECLASARWDFTGDSKSLSLVERSVAAAERLVGLVVYNTDYKTKSFGNSIRGGIHHKFNYK